MFIEPTITWVLSGFSGYIWLNTKIVLKITVDSRFTRFNSTNCIRNIIATVGLQILCLEPFGRGKFWNLYFYTHYK